jgi:teichuronic acid biosynthesis glycosyltransferase TuaC
MKVLVLSHMYPSTANEVSGIFVHEQVKALVEKGVDVRVVSPVPWAPFPINQMTQKWKAYSRIPVQSVWDGIKVSYPRYLAFPKGWFFASSGKRMYHGIRKVVAEIYREFPFDLIHAHVVLPDGYAGAILSEDFGCPLVVTIHGQDLQHTIHRGPRCKEALSYALRKASRVIVVSHKLERLMERFFPSEKGKVVTIPNGINPEEISAAIAMPYLENTEGPLIVSVSNLVKTKGVDLNILAVHHLSYKYPLVRYLVVGDGPEATTLRELVRRLDLEERVRFVGRVPHQQALKYIASCDIFSLPSWSEGFGIVYLEAMACSKPVVGCKGEGLEDFVEHGVTGVLVEPKSVDSLVEALDFLLSHPDEAKAMGKRAREVVLANYTWEKNAEKTIAVYREVLR